MNDEIAERWGKRVGCAVRAFFTLLFVVLAFASFAIAIFQYLGDEIPRAIFWLLMCLFWSKAYFRYDQQMEKQDDKEKASVTTPASN